MKKLALTFMALIALGSCSPKVEDSSAPQLDPDTEAVKSALLSTVAKDNVTVFVSSKRVINDIEDVDATEFIFTKDMRYKDARCLTNLTVEAMTWDSTKAGGPHYFFDSWQVYSIENFDTYKDTIGDYELTPFDVLLEAAPGLSSFKDGSADFKGGFIKDSDGSYKYDGDMESLSGLTLTVNKDGLIETMSRTANGCSLDIELYDYDVSLIEFTPEEGIKYDGDYDKEATLGYLWTTFEEYKEFYPRNNEEIWLAEDLLRMGVVYTFDGKDKYSFDLSKYNNTFEGLSVDLYVDKKMSIPERNIHSLARSATVNLHDGRSKTLTLPGKTGLFF